MRSIAVLLLVLIAGGGLAYLLFMGESTADPLDVSGTGNQEQVANTTDQTRADLSGSKPEREVIKNTEKVDIALESTELTAKDYASGILGRVLNEDGEPVEGAKILLAYADDMFRDQPGIGSADKPDRTMETDEEGNYRFDHLEPADYYTVFASHEQYGSGRLSGVRVPFQVYDEQPDLVLSMGSALRGTVTDPAGNPIMGAVVTIGSDVFNHRASKRDMKTGETNDVGEYAIPDIPGGTFAFVVEAEGFATHYMVGLPFDGIKPRTRDVQLEFAEGIAGLVTDKKGSPVAGARVTGIRYKNSKLAVRDSDVTTPSGEFSLDNLEAGDYTILVDADGYGPGRNNVVPTGTTNVTIEVMKRATISGQVVSAQDGSALASGKVILREVIDGTRITNPTQWRAPIQGGKFEIAGVPGGDYLVEGSSVRDGFAPTFSQPFTVVEGEDLDGILVQATAGANVTGRIVDADGRPVANAEVSTEDKAGYLPGWPTNIIPQKVRTDGGGNFRLRALKPEVYRINVVAPGFVKFMREDVVIAEGQDRDLGTIELSRGGTVEGVLTDHLGQPVVGGQVFMQLLEAGARPRPYSAKSKNDGLYRVANVHPGRYKLWSVPMGVDGPAPGGKRTELKIQVIDNVVTNQDITLDYSTVRTHDGRPPRPGMKYDPKASMQTQQNAKQNAANRARGIKGGGQGGRGGGGGSRGTGRQQNSKPNQKKPLR